MSNEFHDTFPTVRGGTVRTPRPDPRPRWRRYAKYMAINAAAIFSAIVLARTLGQAAAYLLG